MQDNQLEIHALKKVVDKNGCWVTLFWRTKSDNGQSEN